MQPSVGYWQSFVEYAELTDVGLRRANNQDSLATMLAGSEADFFRRGHLFLVADGMGRHAAGELASKIAADTVPLQYFKQPQVPPPLALRQALEEGNRRIFERGRQNPDFAGMGTTTCVLVLLPQGALVGHVGDSRIYRLRRNHLEQLTFDHSVVWEMQAAAKSNNVQPPANIPKNYITRSLGHDAAVKVDLEGPFPLESGDTFLLCSDGLSGQVEDDEIAAILSCVEPTEAAQALVDLANLRGGPDNITVIVARVRDAARVQNALPPAAGGSLLGRVSMPVWVAVGASLLLSSFAFMAAQAALGTAAAGAAIVALAVAGWQILTSGSPGKWKPRALGRGPHTRTELRLGDVELDKFRGTVTKLRESAAHQSWTVDFEKGDRLLAEAAVLRKSGDAAGTLRNYCRTLSHLMRQIRKQRRDVGREPVLDD